MDNKIVNLELKMINVEKTVQMVEQDTRVSLRVQGSLIKPNLEIITFQNKSLEIEVMERDMKDQLTDDINEIRVEFLQNWEKFMRRQNEMQADFDFLNNAMNEGKFSPWYIFKQPDTSDPLTLRTNVHHSDWFIYEFRIIDVKNEAKWNNKTTQLKKSNVQVPI